MDKSVAPQLRIGIDTGGTFTDIVSVDGRSGAMHVTKVASTPANPAIGLVRGVNAILAQTGGSIDDVAGLAHGTTVATNALLQGRDRFARPDRHGGLPAHPGDRAPVGAGRLRQFLFLGEARPHRAAAVRARGRRAPEFPRRRSCGRSTSRACAPRRDYFRRHDVQAIGICLIHSYANAAHERRVAEIVAEEYPEGDTVAVLRRCCPNIANTSAP